MIARDVLHGATGRRRRRRRHGARRGQPGGGPRRLRVDAAAGRDRPRPLRRCRAVLRKRPRRRVRLRRLDARRLRRGDAAGDRPAPLRRRRHAVRADLDDRSRPAAGRQAGAGGPLDRSLCRVLPPVGPRVGAPGDAAGPSRRRRRRSGASGSSRCWRTSCGSRACPTTTCARSAGRRRASSTNGSRPARTRRSTSSSGRGSLSDVEWTVQLLQLRTGVRSTSTYAAIDALVEADVLLRADADELAAAYRFCEVTRNRLVLVAGAPLDALPPQGSTTAAVASPARSTRRRHACARTTAASPAAPAASSSACSTRSDPRTPDVASDTRIPLEVESVGARGVRGGSPARAEPDRWVVRRRG